MSSLAPTKRDYPTNTLPGDPGLFPWFRKVLVSTVGSKFILALSGWGLTGFVIIHMLGNIQLFAGQEAVNRYAQWLKDLGPLLWVARIGLLIVFLFHVIWAVRLSLKSKAARPVAYVYKDTVQASLASRTMLLTGLVIFAFLLYHLAHYTFGFTGKAEAAFLPVKSGPAAARAVGSTQTAAVKSVSYLDLRDDRGRHDVYNMVIFGFEQPVVAVLYILAQLVLLMHLSHGVQSTFQSLGINGPRWQTTIRAFGWAVALIVTLGNIAIVVGVWAGWTPHTPNLYAAF
ncbi:MAG: succinate dehydrogenase cytochrome b subunit [Gemmataceae bacterium]